MVFDRYSACYDLLYRDKDYAAEAVFVDGLIRRFAPGVGSVLELGCGTGMHAGLLAERGYRIHGVDRSEEMLRRAAARHAALPAATAERLAFAKGDVRALRLGKTFDCVLSLFHVVSYQPANSDLQAMFETARAHTRPGGLFVFDCWYGPAVLTERPAVRVKRVQNEQLRVTRIAEPAMHPNECIVDVQYTVFVEDRATGAVEQLQESHRMRYLFLPEIETLLAGAGMKLEQGCEWLTGAPLGPATWSACFVARA